jgi:hypothetical protein
MDKNKPLYLINSVGIVTRRLVGRPRNRGLIPGRGKRFLSSPLDTNQRWTQLVFCSISSDGFSAAGHHSGREADYSPPFSDEIKNVGIHIRYLHSAMYLLRAVLK